jgi:hypothetical protein
MNAGEFDAYLAAHAAELGERLKLIQTGRVAFLAHHKAQQQAQEDSRKAAAAERRALESELVAQVLAFLPDDLKTSFPALSAALVKHVEEMPNYGLTHCYDLLFTVCEPGLAPVKFKIERSLNNSVPERLHMYVFVAHNQSGGPEYRDIEECVDLADCLFRAALQAALMAQYEAEAVARAAELAADQEAEEAAIAADKRAQHAERLAKDLEQKATNAEQSIEIERIIAWAKSDPAVIHLIRAFIAIEEQRTSFQDRLDRSDEAASDAWRYLEHRSAELRQEADAARRQAEEARRAARTAAFEAEEARQQIRNAERSASNGRY